MHTATSPTAAEPIAARDWTTPAPWLAFGYTPAEAVARAADTAEYARRKGVTPAGLSAATDAGLASQADCFGAGAYGVRA